MTNQPLDLDTLRITVRDTIDASLSTATKATMAYEDLQAVADAVGEAVLELLPKSFDRFDAIVDAPASAAVEDVTP